LRTTVGSSGILIGSGNKGESYTREYRVEFFKKCIELLRNQESWKHWSAKSLENVQNKTWKKVAERWVNEVFN
jgi:hypothetical protein